MQVHLSLASVPTQPELFVRLIAQHAGLASTRRWGLPGPL